MYNAKSKTKSIFKNYQWTDNADDSGETASDEQTATSGEFHLKSMKLRTWRKKLAHSKLVPTFLIEIFKNGPRIFSAMHIIIHSEEINWFLSEIPFALVNP